MEADDETVVRWPGRLVRGLLRTALALCCLAFALPLLASLWPSYAVHAQSPVRLSRLPDALQGVLDLRPGSGDRFRVGGGRVTLEDAAPDPWGEPYRVLPSLSGERDRDWVVYSTGPNRRDEGGGGDDLRVGTPAARLLAGARWGLGQLALLCLTLALLAEFGSPPQRERLLPELVRSAALAALPAALCVAYVLTEPRWLEVLVAPVRSLLVLPLSLSAACFSAALCFLVALRFRTWRASAAEGERWPGAWQRRRAWAAAVLGLSVAAVGYWWDLLRERAHEEAEIVALAQLGGENAIHNLASTVALGLGGEERLRRFLRHAPRGPYYDTLGATNLSAIADQGEVGLEVMLGALPRNLNRPRQRLRDYLRRYDPAASRLAAEFDGAERPALLHGTLVEFEQELLARWGRRGMIERVLTVAEDPAFNTHAGCEDLLALALDLCGVPGAPPLGLDNSSPEAYRAWREQAVRTVRAWVERQPTLPPRWWITLRLFGSPPKLTPQARPRQMELRVRFADGGERHIPSRGYYTLAGRHSLARRPSSLEVLADGQWLWLVPLSLPEGDAALRVELEWGEEPRVKQWAIPGD